MSGPYYPGGLARAERIAKVSIIAALVTLVLGFIGELVLIHVASGGAWP